MSNLTTGIPAPLQGQHHEGPTSPLKRLIIGLVLMTAVVGALAGYQLLHSRTQALHLAGTNGKALAGILQQAIGGTIQKTDLTIRHVADEVSHQSVSGGLQPDVLDRFIEHQFQQIPELDSLRITDAAGKVLLGSGQVPTMAVSIADRDYFIYLRDHPASGLIISKPILGRISKKWVITCARRINLADGSFGGIVYAVLPLQQFDEFFKSVPIGSHGTVSLRTEDLSLISRYSPAQQTAFTQDPVSTRILEAWRILIAQGATQSGSYTTDSASDDTGRIYSYRRISPYPLYVNVGLALDDVLAKTRQELFVVTGLFGLFVFMSVMLAWLIQRNWQKTFAAEQELKRNYERLELMQEVNQYHSTDVQELLDFALEKVLALTDSSIGYIYHYNEEQRQFVLNTWSKGVMAACRVAEPQSVYHLDMTGLWGEVVRQRTAIIVNDFDAANPLKKGYPEGHVHLTRFLSVPIFENDRIVAVVGVANKTRPYDQSDLLQLTLLMEGVWKITARISLEDQVSRAGHEWQNTFDSIRDSIALIDTDQRILRCNLATCTVLGRDFSDILGQPCWKLFHGTDAPIQDCPMVRAKQSLHSETTTIQHNDRWLEVSVDPQLSETGVLVGAVHLVRDVTERKQSEEALHDMQAQMMQNDKMATIGQLAAGVAHEINNPMGFVGSNMVTLEKYIGKYHKYIDLIEQELRSCSSGLLPEQVQAVRQSLKLDYVMRDISVLVEESNEGIERVKHIVQDLQTFSRADSSTAGAADLNSCMNSTINIIINEIKYAAELRCEYGDLPKVHCNIQQINQVFMNMLINAVHAIQDKGNEIGEIVVRTWCDSDNAYVSVTDTGCGIAPENQSRIFDAFYTTKEIGKGTGLGLSITSGIIRKHGGEITLSSEVGVGSTFTVRLPVNSTLQQTEQSD